MLAAISLGRISHEITLAAIVAVTEAMPITTIALAAGLTALSYVILTGYDWLALNHLGYRLRLSTMATAAFTSFTMSHTLGMTALTGGSVRYRIYTRVGVRPRDIVLIIALCGWTFWLGLVLAAGIGLIADPAIADALAIFPRGLGRAAGAVLLAGAAGYAVVTAIYRSEICLFGLRMRLPGWRTTLAQVLVGGFDLVAAAGALYLLLPAGGPPFIGIVVVYAVAMIAGALSHAPGGLGVFEAMILVMLPDLPKDGVLAALLLFRVLYTLIPFTLGLVLLGRGELVALKSRRGLGTVPFTHRREAGRVPAAP